MQPGCTVCALHATLVTTRGLTVAGKTKWESIGSNTSNTFQVACTAPCTHILYVCPACLHQLMAGSPELPALK